MSLSFSTAARIAWRETRSSTVKFAFVVLGVSAGVGALAGVRGFSQSFQTLINREARTLLAGDLSARQFVPPTLAQTAALDGLEASGVERTQITETVSMASPGGAAASDAVVPVLVSIKAVDPKAYPYYGEVKLNPAMPLVEALTADSVAVGEDLLIRLGIKVGDTLRLGGQDFRVSAIVVSEPDRMTGSLNIGLRLMLSREALARTGLMQLGSRAASRMLFKLGPGAPPVEKVREQLKNILPEALLADIHESHPLVKQGLERSTVFLSLVSLIALIVGAIGVGMSMHSHLQQKMDSIAVMKSLGAASGEIIRIFVIQTTLLGLFGGLGGVIVGQGIERIFPILVSRLFSISAPPTFHPWTILQSIAVGVLTTLLFTLPPLLAIRKVRPALILRRDMPEARLPWRARLGEIKGSIGVGAAILAGLGAIAAWLASSPKVGGYFVLGLAASLLVLALVAAGLMRGLRFGVKNAPWRLSALTRQGLSNLYRQGNQAQAILVSLGLGVMFTLTVYLVQSSLVSEIIATAPPEAPNVFLIGVSEDQVDQVKAMISEQPGLLGPPELSPSVAARIVAIDGVPPDQRASGEGRRFTSGSVMWETEQPNYLKIDEGSWWTKDTTEPVVSVSTNIAKALELKLGTRIEYDATGTPIHARVVAIHEVVSVRSAPTSNMIFNKPALEGLPATFNGGARMKPSSIGELQRVAFKRFPTVTVVNIADALDIAQQVVDQIALVIRFLSGFAILAGAIILAASVAGTRFRRVRETVILKTVGGTRAQIRRIFSIEFTVLGAVAGLLGAALATAFSSIALKRLLDASFHFDWKATLTAVLLTAVLANVSGGLASAKILSQKPLEVLRSE